MKKLLNAIIGLLSDMAIPMRFQERMGPQAYSLKKRN